ncbi:hypothetical protein INR49_014965 [Caranx melampygus]|nr:hypothetical protein INR49_014965 [Caranx melampygus]
MKRGRHTDRHRADANGFTQGSEMKKQRESQCTQKTISLLSPLGTIQVSGCENGVHTIQILMDVAPAERSSGAPLSCVVNDSPAETSPELQCCVEWLQAYFSEPQTAGSLPLPAFHHPALQGGLSWINICRAMTGIRLSLLIVSYITYTHWLTVL